MRRTDRAKTIEANQKVHTQLALTYQQDEPHYRPENKEVVRLRIQEVVQGLPSRDRMLDLCCGSGFLLDLTHDFFDRIHGVDATSAMLDLVDMTPGNIELHQGLVEELPFPDSHFDLVTGYSFLDHIAEPQDVFREASRVLKAGGKIYFDLIPNANFWDRVYESSTWLLGHRSPFVQREIDEVVHHEDKLRERYGIDPADWRLAEPSKSDRHGFSDLELAAMAEDSGFTDIRVEHSWFLGQAHYMHQRNDGATGLVNEYLQSALPNSSGLFKYLTIVATRS